MTLPKLYLLWLASLIISVVTGILYFIIGMQLEYGSLYCGDFECLPYVVYGPLIIFASTGVIVSLLAYTFTRKANKPLAIKLAKNLALLYGVILIVAAFTTNYAFIYLNPLSFVIFILLPLFAWKSTQDKRTIWIWLTVFVLLVVLLFSMGGFVLYNIISSLHSLN